MKILKITLLFAFFSAGSAFGQAGNGQFMINGYTGAIFDGNGRSLDEILVMGIEGNYFFGDHISFTGGLDYQTAGSGSTYAVVGNRIYFTDYLFVRQRTSINLKSRFSYDVLFGLGYDFMISDNWALEVNTDYHVPSRGIGAKVGLSWFL